MEYIPQILFLILLVVGFGLFGKSAMRIRRNVLLGRDIDRSDNASKRMNLMLKVALGQSKMVVRPIAGALHIIVYAGFLLINIEVLEIIIDGLFGTHRIFAPILGGLYTAAINFFEILGVLVIIACAIFLWRRNVMKIGRFHSTEMKGWPFKDANYILIIEIVLMTALLVMNAAEGAYPEGHHKVAPFIISGLFSGFLEGMSYEPLHLIERVCWWAHIAGILFFLNYLPYSKHFHIILAFPNVYFSKLTPKGQFTNLESVKKEVELMLDPNADPYAAAPAPDPNAAPQRFGAKDVQDLSWVQLMNAYSCTECGRCTSNCPANVTGKKLSPRKIMMDTRDRLEEVGAIIDMNKGTFVDDGKSLLHDYITPEELWACTSCNACTEACPVNIDPLSIIVDLRRYLVMEESSMPAELTPVMSNIENNGAPWQFAQADRANWITEE
ncbi:MAG: (Fe-S)-binding protein [Flavobacteriales bacterium]|nr:(Fe-S)-binding protein [Flavobacteriales bacterium]MCB9191972.1 (Fe-S)-binding protein [Flavobacteriales bacterium]MCB9204992.1 (Fe-S)-binding protein [Flavobacteriales bacterium]